MKLQLIMTEPPIIVDLDAKIELNKKFYSKEFNCIDTLLKGGVINEDLCFKIIAGLPKLPNIDFSSLSEEDCKKIGYVDVEKLANSYIKKLSNVPEHYILKYAKEDFIEGFKLAQQMNDKKYSEEDMKKAIEMATHINPSDTNRFYSSEEIIQSLIQPRVYDIEVEMETKTLMKPCDVYSETVSYIKTTNNSIKITKIL